MPYLIILIGVSQILLNAKANYFISDIRMTY